ncbi:MAG: putative glutamine-dependent NAD(+) synthetase [Acidimicrobiia bacterium]|nr:MAG: putative glutamine-dependent NAD(+) synthetase [Acidimicrobiia bacterium]
MPRLRVAAAQIDAVVGDLDGNVERMLAAYEDAEAQACDLVVFPELSVTGYPPEDLLLRPAFVAGAAAALDKFAARTGRCAAVVGFPEAGRDLHNAAALCAHGRVHGVYRKHLLPNYGVFDEQRYFVPGAGTGPLFSVGGVTVGVTICEDAWSPTGPVLEQADAGAELVVNLNASPYYAGRLAERETMLATRAADASVPIVYANLVGGQDELVFDGASLVFDEHGRLVARARQFAPDLLVVDVEVRPAFRKRLLDPRGRGRAAAVAPVPVSDAQPPPEPVAPRVEAALPPVHEVYEALVLGTRDYVRKNGFTDVLVGLSGGIDSSLVAAIAVDALGPEHVTGVLMPSRHSSEGSVTDALALAASLGIRTHTVPIEPAHRAFEEMLEGVVDATAGVAAENVQSRIRGNVLMTISNATGWLVLTTGNKSEMATGYATLYGDMAGGFAVIKDVEKTLVWELARDRNARAGREIVPQSVIDKAPSAELRPGQRDTDSLPPYDVLDPIVEGYVEEDLSIAELEARGHDPDLVRRVARMIDRNEYKRRQAPPGVRVSPKAFGKDRRLPITNRWPG